MDSDAAMNTIGIANNDGNSGTVGVMVGVNVGAGVGGSEVDIAPFSKVIVCVLLQFPNVP